MPLVSLLPPKRGAHSSQSLGIKPRLLGRPWELVGLLPLRAVGVSALGRRCLTGSSFCLCSPGWVGGGRWGALEEASTCTLRDNSHCPGVVQGGWMQEAGTQSQQGSAGRKVLGSNSEVQRKGRLAGGSKWHSSHFVLCCPQVVGLVRRLAVLSRTAMAEQLEPFAFPLVSWWQEDGDSARSPSEEGVLSQKLPVNLFWLLFGLTALGPFRNQTGNRRRIAPRQHEVLSGFRVPR